MSEIRRRLQLSTAAGAVAVDVAIEAPLESVGYWSCSYTIGWPEGVRRGEARGADGVQAMCLALEGIALDLYASEHHRRGRLYWQKPGRGYGFPIPKPARDVLVGDDRDLQL